MGLHPIYTDDMWTRAMRLLNELAPVTRRDSWWEDEGPLEIICQAFTKLLEESER